MGLPPESGKVLKKSGFVDELIRNSLKRTPFTSWPIDRAAGHVGAASYDCRRPAARCQFIAAKGREDISTAWRDGLNKLKTGSGLKKTRFGILCNKPDCLAPCTWYCMTERRSQRQTKHVLFKERRYPRGQNKIWRLYCNSPHT